MSGLLTRVEAAKAVEMVLPAVQALMGQDVLKRRHLHIVVLDPAFTPADIPVAVWQVKAILFEHSVGDRKEWKKPYDTFARSKAFLSWRYGLPTQAIQSRCPHLLEAGETVYYGSAISDGLVVGVSGVQPYFDQMIASWVLEACRALAIERHLEVKTDYVT